MKKLGLHYYSDTNHYRQQDLELWLPRLKNIGATWLTLTSPSTHAIPEIFLRGLVEAGIKPLVHLPFHLDQLPSRADFELFFKTYARHGVQHVILFTEPNTRAQWGAISWAKTNLVERFLDTYLPLAESALKVGLTPVFPPLKQGGDYWDTSFLQAALDGLQRRASSHLVDALTLSVDASLNNHPLGWGAGGPERWPQSRPYFTPPGSEDQRGFRIIDWYSAIAESTLGKTLPTFMLNLGGNAAPTGESSPTGEAFPAGESFPAGRGDQRDRTIIALLAHESLPNIEPLPPQVKAGIFHAQNWYNPTGENHAIIKYLAQRTSTPEAKGLEEKPLEHYVLLPTYDGAVTDWHLKVIQGFIKKHTPTVGFSHIEAAHAKQVTVIGGESGVSASKVNQLRAQGCLVRRITGDGTEIAAKLNSMTSLQKDQFHHKGTKFTKNSLEEHKEKLCTL